VLCRGFLHRFFCIAWGRLFLRLRMFLLSNAPPPQPPTPVGQGEPNFHIWFFRLPLGPYGREVFLFLAWLRLWARYV
jgi:hypothetical protein